jgi:hypothetical protein
VSLAIEILRVEPKKDSKSDPLRDWAVDVLKLDSPVPISAEAQTQRRSNRLAYDRAFIVQALEQLVKDGVQVFPTPTPNRSSTP